MDWIIDRLNQLMEKQAESLDFYQFHGMQNEIDLERSKLDEMKEAISILKAESNKRTQKEGKQ